ncbi:MAG: dehydrogenase E1 component subunit alpha/beta [Saprospiraceae bacterium]|nr:dehydrogenase E1 component subunit alpha/beta [Saprospiraceae bacterium]
MKKTVKYDTKRLSKKKQIELYRALLKPRLIEEKMLILLRQGKISKWFAGIGQEAISVGCTSALQADEKIFPMHRNLGVFTTREVPMKRLFCQWQGKLAGFTKGRDRSFHFGAPDYNIVGMISHLGPQLSLADGVALSHKLNNRNKIALAFTGEGGTSQGEFHEALNVAAVWKLPVIFVIENNGYGLSTPTNEQYACENLADRALGYGMRHEILDGNNVVEVYETIDRIAKKIRKSPEPYLIECKTFRMRGHEEASGTKYVPQDLMDMWAKKDPLTTFEKHLIKSGVISKKEVDQWTQSIKEEINAELAASYEEPVISSSAADEINDVYAPHQQDLTAASSVTKEMRFIDAITSGLQESMRMHPNLVLMGQDIADYGGVFKVTDGFVAEFGKERVRNTPLCESAIVGAALGLTMEGDKAMMEMQFADFVSCGFNQIVNNLAKIHYRWGHKADVVIRMPTGGGMGAGPFHSQSNEAWFTKTPGLKVVYPSTPHDAKGLLIAAFNDPNPVLFFEHKGLYRNIVGEVPNDSYEVEIGKAKKVNEGEDLTIITYGMGVHWAKKYQEESQTSIDIIDLVSLSPIDYKTIEESVKKTNRVIVLHEDTLFGGIAGDISAYISEHLFEHLDAPVCRVASLDTPVPFDKGLEQIFLPIQRLKEKIDFILAY